MRNRPVPIIVNRTLVIDLSQYGFAFEAFEEHGGVRANTLIFGDPFAVKHEQKDLFPDEVVRVSNFYQLLRNDLMINGIWGRLAELLIRALMPIMDDFSCKDGKLTIEYRAYEFPQK